MSEARCPFPHGEAGGDAPPEWSEESQRRAHELARAKAPHSRLDADRAAAMATRAVESRAEQKALPRIDLAFLEQVGRKMGYGHPLSERTGSVGEFTWTPEAEARLQEVPEFCRDLTRWRVEWTAHKKGLGHTITPEVMDVKYSMWGEVSHHIEEREGRTLPWTDAAVDRLARIPEFVRGQVIQAVEGNARRVGAELVDDDVIDATIERWSSSGDFHEGRYGFR
jgi:Proto-chlorophyllide reductase 57 kD subunit